jgi:hypothetical protein
VERRDILAAAVSAFYGLFATAAMAGDSPPADIRSALARFRASIPANFDREYVEHVLIPFFLTSLYIGERPLLPMIDRNLSKENASPAEAVARGGCNRVLA